MMKGRDPGRIDGIEVLRQLVAMVSAMVGRDSEALEGAQEIQCQLSRVPQCAVDEHDRRDSASAPRLAPVAELSLVQNSWGVVSPANTSET